MLFKSHLFSSSTLTSLLRHDHLRLFIYTTAAHRQQLPDARAIRRRGPFCAPPRARAIHKTDRRLTERAALRMSVTGFPSTSVYLWAPETYSRPSFPQTKTLLNPSKQKEGRKPLYGGSTSAFPFCRERSAWKTDQQGQFRAVCPLL